MKEGFYDCVESFYSVTLSMFLATVGVWTPSACPPSLLQPNTTLNLPISEGGTNSIHTGNLVNISKLPRAGVVTE
jgi:hypothetical protein